MAQNTALQELKQWVDDNYPNFNKADIEAKIDALLPKERQQIIDGYNQGYRDGESNGDNETMDVAVFSDAEQYLTNTFNHQ